MTVGLIIPVAFGMVMNELVELSNIWQYLCAIAIYVFIYFLSMWFLGINVYERKMFLRLLKVS